MKESNNETIDNIAKKGDGLTVPDGFFDDFALKMSSSLPFREELDCPVAQQRELRNTRWQRVRPYVYLAAMFAGAWCLLKMFSLMNPTEADVRLENYPTLQSALENEQFVDEYLINDVTNFDIVEEYYRETTGEEYFQNEEETGDDSEEFTEPKAAADDEPSYILPSSDSQDQSQPISTQNNDSQI